MAYLSVCLYTSTVNCTVLSLHLHVCSIKLPPLFFQMLSDVTPKSFAERSSKLCQASPRYGTNVVYCHSCKPLLHMTVLYCHPTPQLPHSQSMVDVLRQFDDWFSPTGCITAVVESGVLLKALRALRYVLMKLM